MAGHFGVQKTLDTLNESFYFPNMMKDVHIVVSKCATCQRSKSTFHKGLYTSLPVPDTPWIV